MKKREGGYLKRGFTLVELLVVMAVLGVLMAGIIIAINPIQQMARARDASRKNAIGQIGTALAGYYTAHSAVYPAADANWLVGTAADPDGLVYAGELKSAPPSQTYSAAGASTCPVANFNVNGYCYAVAGAAPAQEAVAWTNLESASARANCAALTPNAVWFYSTVGGKACGACTAAAGIPATTTDCTFQ